MKSLTAENARNYVGRKMIAAGAVCLQFDSVTEQTDESGSVYFQVSGRVLDTDSAGFFDWDVWLESNGEIYGEW